MARYGPSTPTLQSDEILGRRADLCCTEELAHESKNDAWVYWEGSGDCDLSRVKDLSIGGLFIQTLWLANCYFAHNSLRFPALLCSVRPAYHFIVLSTRNMSEVHGCGVNP
jgi:hypothetical protein